MKISKKKTKKTLELTSLYTSVPKIMIIFYIAPELWRVTDVIVAPPPSNNMQKMKFSRKTKKHLDISSFYTSVP